MTTPDHLADRIVVVDETGIAEQGTHEALLREGGRYRQLHDAQVGVSAGR